MNLYTATLTIVGEVEPLLHTRFCPTLVDALCNLRIMIIVSEDPSSKERLKQAKKAAMDAREERGEDAAVGGAEEGIAEDEDGEGNAESDHGKGNAEKGGDGIVDEELLARMQWDFTLAQLAGKMPRQIAGGREKRDGAGR